MNIIGLAFLLWLVREIYLLGVDISEEFHRVWGGKK